MLFEAEVEAHRRRSESVVLALHEGIVDLISEVVIGCSGDIQDFASLVSLMKSKRVLI